MVVDRLEEMHKTEGLSYRALCAREGMAYASLMRWKHLRRSGGMVLGQPGPKKVMPLDLEGLREEIRVLRHGRKRSEGTGDLYRRQRDRVSRRQLGRWVAEARRQKNRERNQVYDEVTWKAPRMVWAMDDTEYHPDPQYPKAFLHNVQDLGSRYKFEPLVGLTLAHGDEVAVHLEHLFKVHGPPLFLKRDNGKNLNHTAIEELLKAFLVIPVNSPCYYPQYNGGIEAAQREIKQDLPAPSSLPSGFLAIQAELDVQSLNHRPRRCLANRSPCQVFTFGQDLSRTFTRRKRREVYEWIRQKTLDLMQKECYHEDAAWRLAVQTWLQENGFITVITSRKVLPSFPENRSHD